MISVIDDLDNVSHSRKSTYGARPLEGRPGAGWRLESFSYNVRHMCVSPDEDINVLLKSLSP